MLKECLCAPLDHQFTPHTALPGREQTVGIDCAIVAFANSSLLIESPPGKDTLIAPISEIRGRFANVAQHLLLSGSIVLSALNTAAPTVNPTTENTMERTPAACSNEHEQTE
ncbi:hypothetical protein EMPG_12352 [Blastomyces silverae]|uniref:Uncharacterized protein n=1 Tax=Blastomyces silverae TaxID=2060906 RepID=A0A0H1BNN2_9EURO|nr:hypothetical protein EMPG_12352 [Blastomyces silverae]